MRIEADVYGVGRAVRAPTGTTPTTFWAQIPAIDALLSGAEAAAARAIDAVSEAFAAHERPDGVWLGSAAWLVTASRP